MDTGRRLDIDGCLLRNRGSKKFVGLEWIIASADMIEHAIPNREELKLSLSKLISHGVVELKETKFRINKKLASSVAEAWSRRGGLSVGPDKGLWWLKQAPLQVSRRSTYALTVNQYAEAVKSYLTLHQQHENSSK